MTMVHVQADNPQEEEVPKASTRVRAIALISRTGTRAQKRAIAAGKGIAKAPKAAGGWMSSQITTPYSTLKMAGSMVLTVAIVAIQVYVVIYVLLAAAILTGSWIIAILAAVVGLGLAQIIMSPITAANAKYVRNAQMNMMSEPKWVFPTY